MRFRSQFIFYFFAQRCPIPSATLFLKKIIFPLLNCFCALVINQLGVRVSGNGEMKTSKSPLPHKTNRNTGKKWSKSTFSVLWRLTKGLQLLQGIISRKKKWLNLGKNSKLYGIFTCLIPIPLVPALLQPWQTSSQSWLNQCPCSYWWGRTEIKLLKSLILR